MLLFHWKTKKRQLYWDLLAIIINTTMSQHNVKQVLHAFMQGHFQMAFYCQNKGMQSPLFTYTVWSFLCLYQLNKKSLKIISFFPPTSFSILPLCPHNPAPVGLTAGYAWSPQCWSSCGPPGPLCPALPAFLPLVPAARLSARFGVHICWELLLLLQPLLGSCVCCYCILLCDVLYYGLYGNTAAPPRSKDSREGESKCIKVYQTKTGTDGNRCLLS